MEDAKKFNKGIFMLVKTSNKSSSDLQDLEMMDRNALYQIAAHYLDSWGSDDVGECGYSLLGAVVGATFPAQAQKLREIMPQAIFLVPGYGAQGGTAKDVKACFDAQGRGALVNSSRSIIYAYKEMPHIHEKDFALAAREAVMKMKKDLESEITFS
jgi:orotidine-5'-phosphate decarboxylase